MILHCSKQSTTTCIAAVVFFLPITGPYAVSNLTLAKKHLVNDKITTSCPICLISTISNVTKCSNNKYELWKTIRAQNVCPSMPSFVSAVLFIPSFNVLSCYFYDSLNLVAVPTAWILINFLIQLLNFLHVCRKHYSTAQLFGGF